MVGLVVQEDPADPVAQGSQGHARWLPALAGPCTRHGPFPAAPVAVPEVRVVLVDGLVLARVPALVSSVLASDPAQA